MTHHTLYGSPLSLYTGRARSYLIKAGLDYRETTPTSEHYAKVVLPAAGNRQGIPTLETADGQVIRDGAAIIDHFEALSGDGFSPSGIKQNLVSRLFDVIGAEGLLRPAMHYRWNFDDQNLEFLRFHFQTMMPKGMEDKTDKAMQSMRKAGQAFGVVPESVNVVESLYETLLDKLDAHFAQVPYLLGNRPCIGDFGMIAPLYSHLGRDPKPLSLMQARAPHLFRWVERMNRPEPDIGEFENQADGYLPDDAIPATLIEVMQHIAVDFVPETLAAAAVINDWLAAQQELPSGATAERGVGFCQFNIDDVTINALVQPYRFYLLARAQTIYDSAPGVEQAALASLLQAAGMREILNVSLTREVGRSANLEVWC
ncbi:glutathione S-transferase family protein [Congregibacter variabilis]|uniref:Glutathione S-transferase family protein n=1 Tax=Congregibacter variabilis TaxID=3081200 RepID=A0ABZ0I5I1_9GAMM|nr:glutathione S-transferase family protein [Congregibacter sp. IMCC43200]